MKKTVYRIVCMTVAVFISVTAFGTGSCETTERFPDTVISEMISVYGASGDLSDPDIVMLEKELQGMDPARVGLWKGILDYWDRLNSVPVNPEKLPDGLPEDHRLCIVILGYQLEPDGGIRPELEGRLKTGLACAGQYPDAWVLCTGGGTAARNREATEAEVMGDWLIGNGLEKDRLIIENSSMSTTENALYSAEILQSEYPEIDSVVIVSSAYHIPWGQLLFEAAFRMNAAMDGAPEVHAISNAGYMIDNPGYSNIMGYQTSGLNSLLRRRTGRTLPAASGN